MKYSNIKLFDCQSMPSDIRRIFLDKHSRSINDIVVEVDVYGWNDVSSVEEFNELNIDESLITWKKIERGTVYYNVRGREPLGDWFIDNGAEPHEEILVKHWW